MIPFPMKVGAYQAKMNTLKNFSKVVPFPKPTMFSGPGSSLKLCEAIAHMGMKKILIVTDAMLIKLGLLDKIQAELKNQNIEFIIYDGIQPDPTIDQIEAGLKVLKDNQCQAILAVGGGSSIDAAKVIAARATNDKPISKMEGLFKVYKAILPLYAIPTTAGTGSEVTVAAVVSDPVAQKKSPIMDPKLVPAMAALDGELMTGLPPAITAATGMDALTHAVEAYISKNAVTETDTYAIAATKLIMQNLPTAFKTGDNLEARQNMAMASYYAAVAFTRAGVGYVHAIAHNFGAYYHTPHGLANAIILPYVLEFSKDQCADRLADLAEAAGLKQDGDTDKVLADKFIARIREMNKEFGIPEKHDKLKWGDIPDIADAALKEAHSTYAVPKYMEKRECQQFIAQMLA